MLKQKDKFIVLSIIALSGLFLVLKSTAIGISLAESWLQNQGGSANTDYYHMITKSYTSSIMITGTVLLAAGVFYLLGYLKK